MLKKIALEEHFSGPGFEHYLQAVADSFDPGVLKAIEKLLPDFNDQRLATMDEAGIEIAVLSQTAPGVQQERDTTFATKSARQNNDFLAEAMRKYPNRYRGFACVALQDPRAACKELERCVKELGFVGVLLNGHTNGAYLDEKQFWPFWEQLATLDVPVYLHPGNPYDKPHMYAGRPELNGATWSWTCETSTHALRLIFGGTFDHFPTVKVILGHMGETIPFYLWRIDSRAQTSTAGRALNKTPSEYFRDHFVITTSGVCAHAPLICSLTELGEDNVMFSVDYPYEDTAAAVTFIETAPLTQTVKEKVCYLNAQRILKLQNVYA